MRRIHLGIQTAIVLTMVGFASWPQFRPVRAQSIWRYAPSAVLQARTLDAARYAGASLGTIRPAASLPASDSNLPEQSQSPGPQTPVQTPDAPIQFTPGVIAMLGGTDNALIGLARNSLNAPIPYARVLLRNISTGEVQGRATADELGRFSFVDLEPDTYVVELLGPDGAVVAASSMVKMSKGRLGQTVVRVAAAAVAVVALLGSAITPALQNVTTMASGNDVTRTTTAQTPRVTSTGN
jgi:hypothetical protein